MTSSSSRFRETKLIRDGGSGKLLLECSASGKRRHSWVVYNAKGDEVLHVQLRRPSLWQRLRQRRGDAGGPPLAAPRRAHCSYTHARVYRKLCAARCLRPACLPSTPCPAGPLPYELVATEPHFPHPCILGQAEEGRLVLRAHSKVKGQEGSPMAEAELFRAAFPATLGGQGGSTQPGPAAASASGSSGSSQGGSPRGNPPPPSPVSPVAVPASPRILPAAGGSAPNTPRSLRRASISSTGSVAAAAAVAAGPAPGVVWEVGCHLAVAPRAETPLMVALCTIYKAALDRHAVDAVREIRTAAAKAAAKAAKAQQRAERAQHAASATAGKACAVGGSEGTAGSSGSPPSPTSSRSGSVTASGGASPPASVGVASPQRSPAGRSPTLSSVGEIEEEAVDELSLRQLYHVQPVAA